MSKDGKVTIFCVNENGFMGNVRAIEARVNFHGRKKYAQYDSAVQVVFTPKGKRTPREIIATYKPYVLIVKGWGHGEPPSPWAVGKPENGVTVTKSKYSSHDEGWIRDFEAWLEPKLAGMEIIADYRGVNTSERKFT